ncbi:MAG: hypothetical protein H6747_04540 [Deltaproteobacteria bacterium]|nr:hypothetical protein [Deltaproteobacteria bacterium]
MRHHHRRLGLLGSVLAATVAILVAAPAVFAAPPTTKATTKADKVADQPAKFIDMGDLVINGAPRKPSDIWIEGRKRVRWGAWLRIAPKNLKPAMIASASELILK